MPLKSAARARVCENLETKNSYMNKQTHIFTHLKCSNQKNDANGEISANCLVICVKINFDAILLDDL